MAIPILLCSSELFIAVLFKLFTVIFYNVAYIMAYMVGPQSRTKGPIVYYITGGTVVLIGDLFFNFSNSRGVKF